MDNLANVRVNINSNIIKLKREWNATSKIWKDAKAREYEKTYLVPIVTKREKLSNDIQTLEKISDKLRNLGIDI